MTKSTELDRQSALHLKSSTWGCLEGGAKLLQTLARKLAMHRRGCRSCTAFKWPNSQSETSRQTRLTTSEWVRCGASGPAVNKRRVVQTPAALNSLQSWWIWRIKKSWRHSQRDIKAKQVVLVFAYHLLVGEDVKLHTPQIYSHSLCCPSATLGKLASGWGLSENRYTILAFGCCV